MLSIKSTLSWANLYLPKCEYDVRDPTYFFFCKFLCRKQCTNNTKRKGRWKLKKKQQKN